MIVPTIKACRVFAHLSVAPTKGDDYDPILDVHFWDESRKIYYIEMGYFRPRNDYLRKLGGGMWSWYQNKKDRDIHQFRSKTMTTIIRDPIRKNNPYYVPKILAARVKNGW